jgi:hypothetical protein
VEHSNLRNCSEAWMQDYGCSACDESPNDRGLAA